VFWLKEKKWQADYIAPLNHLLLLPSGPGRVQQEAGRVRPAEAKITIKD